MGLNFYFNGGRFLLFEFFRGEELYIEKFVLLNSFYCI